MTASSSTRRPGRYGRNGEAASVRRHFTGVLLRCHTGMRHRTERGMLVLADISGFTAFVTTTELEHGPPIIAALLEEVIGELSPPLEIQQVEGDAVFALGPDGVVTPPALLWKILQGAVGAFRARQREMAADMSCSCHVCRSVSNLNLKIVAHHGRFLRHAV